MQTLASNSTKPITTDRDLLLSLLGRRISAQLQTLCFVGAHRFQEAALLDWIFPALKRIYLFEPLPTMQSTLQALAKSDKRITVFPYALADTDGQLDFRVTSNDGESSSLLPLGRHQSLFPGISVDKTIRVETRRLERLISIGDVVQPDFLILDVQGAEHQILSSIPDHVLAKVRLIYSEVSIEPVYEGSRPLSEITALLGQNFVNIGYAPITEDVPIHGNAVFVRKEDLDSAISHTIKGNARRLLQVLGLR